MGIKSINVHGVEILSRKHITAKCTVAKNVPLMLKENKTDTIGSDGFTKINKKDMKPN